jgi:putative colanic acid biosynthesis glycosyltransferase
MKVMQVNCVYSRGSTGKIVYGIHTELKNREIESLVCYGRGEKYDDPNIYKVCSELYAKVNNMITRFSGLKYGGCRVSTNKLISIIKNEKPDIVHLHCINGYFVNIYRLISWLKKHHIKTVLTLHAEFMYTANCSHALDCEKWKIGCGNCNRLREETKSLIFDRTHDSWLQMKKAFAGFENDLLVVSVSPWLRQRAEQSPILKDFRQVVILNGVDTNIFHQNDITDIKKQFFGKKIIFHATSYFTCEEDNIKGGRYVIEIAKRLRVRKIDSIILVAGPYGNVSDLPDNVILLGNVMDQKRLAQFYSMADVTLLTSKREAFSMIVAESLCCGTPVIGFKAGAPETIALSEYCRFFDFGDIDALVAGIGNYQFSKREISEVAVCKYSNKIMCDNYIDEYKKMLQVI